MEFYTSEYTSVEIIRKDDTDQLIIQDKFDARYLQVTLVGKDLLKEIYDKIGEIL